MADSKIKLSGEQKAHVCELCSRHDPSVRDYAEDFELQTQLRDYLEQISGEKVNVADVTRLCDDCYVKVHKNEDESDEREP